MVKFLLLVSAFSACVCVCPVQSLLWLILSFILGAFLMVSCGAGFIGILLILVYVGAIAVLFLFVVMLLNIRKVEMSGLLISYLPVGIVIGFILGLFGFYNLSLGFEEFGVFKEYVYWIKYLNTSSEIESIGYVFFVVYYHYFLILGFILLAVLVGVVVLVN